MAAALAAGEGWMQAQLLCQQQRGVSAGLLSTKHPPAQSCPSLSPHLAGEGAADPSSPKGTSAKVAGRLAGACSTCGTQGSLHACFPVGLQAPSIQWHLPSCRRALCSGALGCSATP